MWSIGTRTLWSLLVYTNGNHIVNLYFAPHSTHIKHIEHAQCMYICRMQLQLQLQLLQSLNQNMRSVYSHIFYCLLLVFSLHFVVFFFFLFVCRVCTVFSVSSTLVLHSNVLVQQKFNHIRVCSVDIIHFFETPRQHWCRSIVQQQSCFRCNAMQFNVMHICKIASM